MEKSRDAFRTISEVADVLDTPAHVLRFWESRFPQIRPVKRAGGRRYYRPSDVALLSGIKRLLHSEGLTIRGVQKVLREHGIRHVMAMADSTIAVDITAEAAAVEEAPKPPKAADILVLRPAAAQPEATLSQEALPLWSSIDDPTVPAVQKTEPLPDPELPKSAEAADDHAEAEPAETEPAAEHFLPAARLRALQMTEGGSRSDLAAVSSRLEALHARMKTAAKVSEH
ncbi:MAG: MerR family transcriptional regulator [Cereibacter sphaeroides]|uniref:MerR family transcriptional regulator n=1 Tax=Cereibacter sphaeroides TaxID=1063 RepID=A0A2W5U7Q4_CERSP|nr:MAG: MerR family transcriptional regulator [Cereibacter sphaeroides]